MTINPLALQKLKNLNEEFVRAFKDASKIVEPEFYDARYGGAIAPAPDEDHAHKLMKEYSQYNRVAGGALNQLAFSDPDDGKKEEIVDTLRGLRDHFEKRATFWKEAARAPFASLGEEKKLSKMYKGYSARLAEVLKLL